MRMWKRANLRLISLSVLLSILCAGCTEKPDGISEENKDTAVDTRQQEIMDESLEIAERYRDIYEAAEKNNALDALETQRQIVERIGEKGNAAVDRNNRINMTNYEDAESFCQSVQEKADAEVTLFSVMDESGFLRYDMKTSKGSIFVTVSRLVWEKDEPQVVYYNEFEAYTWRFTEKGYLFIEEYRPSGYDGAPGEVAFRVKPLDQNCRDYCEKYVYPVGYADNNLFITDWNEQDISEPDFYDLYEKLYYVKYGTNVPYEPYEGAEYEVPAAEFEDVIQSYFNIGVEQIRENTMYRVESESYCYRPRGFREGELPYGPYPEVVACKEQPDGTLRLYIEGVWERKFTDRAVASELVVRPMENGGFQYVSNEVTFWNESLEFRWFTPRMTDEEWQSYYG